MLVCFFYGSPEDHLCVETAHLCPFNSSQLHLLLLLPPVADEDTVKRYFAKFEERFFQTCEKELLKINTFYSGIYKL